jgi:hypothetical protein
MEPLEFGDLLMRRRRRLEALGSWLVGDDHHVGRAVRQTLADTWRARTSLVTEIELDAFLIAHFRAALRAGAAAHR